MKRHNQILSVVLALQIVLLAAVFWPRSAASGGEVRPLLGDLEAADVIALTIEDADGKRVKISKQEGAWVLSDAGDFPCEESKVTGLLDKLVAITADRLVTRTAASHARLQVARDDFLRRIDVETAAGQTITLFLGSSPSYGATHIRLLEQDETYLTDQLPTWEANTSANSWVNTSYVSVPLDDMTSITLRNANGEWTFEKDADGNWTLLGLDGDEELDTAAVDTIVNRVSSMSLLRPLGKEETPAYGLDEPQALVTLVAADKTTTLQVGAKFLEDNSYVVKSSESPYYVRVSEYAVKDLVEKTRDGFIKPPPTPTPPVEGESPAEEG
jgi:hypothetical protein